jgi:ribonuclease P/MRP protein subunit POP5
LKLKAILPSLKQKKRYLVYEIISDKAVDSYAIVRESLMKGILSFLGSLGTAEAGIILLDEKYNAQKQRGIIKVGHRYVDGLKAALTTVEKIGTQKVVLRSMGISGMLNKAEKRYLTDQ